MFIFIYYIFLISLHSKDIVLLLVLAVVCYLYGKACDFSDTPTSETSVGLLLILSISISANNDSDQSAEGKPSKRWRDNMPII